MDRLREWGFDERFAAAFAKHAPSGVEPARVIEEQRGMCRIVTADGERRAETAGRVWQSDVLPVVGDWVVVRRLPGEEGATIHGVLERRSAISRKAAGRTAREQVLAANVDTVFLVTSCNEEFNLRRIERYLTMVCESGARPVLVLNKTDLAGDWRNLSAEAESVALGAAVHGVSAMTEQGLDPIRSHLEPGKTIALLGSSGVGKSTIVNRLLGEDVQEVQEIREDDAQGRHTTRSRQLFRLPGGALVLDTPGLRELALWITDSGLSQSFADVEALAAGCRFRDCGHGSEPGCAVKAAVETGGLEAERLLSYRRLHRELEHLERKVDTATRAETTRRLRTVMRNLRASRKKGWLPDR